MLPFKLPAIASACVLCEAATPRTASLCANCEAELPRITNACRRCALPLPEERVVLNCGDCIQHPSAVDYALSVFHYQAPVDYLIGQMKFQQQLSHTAVLGHLLQRFLEHNEQEHGLPTAILPVPLHPSRLAERGFNQSLEIIKPFAKAHGIPLLRDAVIRIKNTPVQTTLNKKQRQQNMAGSFAFTAAQQLGDAPPPHIVIVDDVVTTGATTQALAKLLKTAGVATVGVWSLARAER